MKGTTLARPTTIHYCDTRGKAMHSTGTVLPGTKYENTSQVPPPNCLNTPADLQAVDDKYNRCCQLPTTSISTTQYTSWKVVIYMAVMADPKVLHAATSGPA